MSIAAAARCGCRRRARCRGRTRIGSSQSSTICLPVPPAASAKSVALAYSAAAMPARRPNTLMSSSELVPSRLEPCTETQAHSPAAYRPGTIVVVVAQHLAVDVGRDAAHHVVAGREHRHRLVHRVDTQVGAGELRDVRQFLSSTSSPRWVTSSRRSPCSGRRRGPRGPRAPSSGRRCRAARGP